MNVLLSQLDGLSFDTEIVVLDGNAHEKISDYYAEGEVRYTFGREVQVIARWEATLTMVAVIKSGERFCAEFLPRIDITECELVSFPWRNQVENSEIEAWLKGFQKSIANSSFYTDICERLSEPALDELEVENCLADRRWWQGISD